MGENGDGLSFREIMKLSRDEHDKKVAILVQALREIVDPISAIKDRLKPGEVINGFMANKIAEDAEYLRSIARRALKAIEEMT